MKTLIYITFVVGCISSLAWGGCRIYHALQFGIRCEAFLTRSVDAKTVDLAKHQLHIAMDYCKVYNLTSGYTSLLFHTEDENISTWYKKIESSCILLDSLDTNASQGEKNNALIRLRKTLLDSNDTGKTRILCPDGISVYPYNRAYMLWGGISLIVLLLSKISLDRH